MTIIELRDALREATHGSWQLSDSLAQVVLGLPPCGTAGPRPYTESLDAAVTLVPEGLPWSLDWEPRWHPPKLSMAEIYVVNREYAAKAPTPALALCLVRVEFEIARQNEIGAVAKPSEAERVANSTSEGEPVPDPSIPGAPIR